MSFHLFAPVKSAESIMHDSEKLLRKLFLVDKDRNFYFCFASTQDEVAEWLRRWTANPLGSARVGSNPILVDGSMV